VDPIVDDGDDNFLRGLLPYTLLSPHTIGSRVLTYSVSSVAALYTRTRTPANEWSNFFYFFSGLFSGNDMSPGRKSFRELNKRSVGSSEVGISEFSLNQDRSKAA
jgi:hypothetical protein